MTAFYVTYTDENDVAIVSKLSWLSNRDSSADDLASHAVWYPDAIYFGVSTEDDDPVSVTLTAYRTHLGTLIVVTEDGPIEFPGLIEAIPATGDAFIDVENEFLIEQAPIGARWHDRDGCMIVKNPDGDYVVDYQLTVSLDEIRGDYNEDLVSTFYPLTRLSGDAEALARCTGSVSATVTREHRDPVTDELVIDSTETWTR
jgi:hypothetical protein